MHTLTQTLTHTSTQTLTHTLTQTLTHTSTQTLTHTSAQTLTHTTTQILTHTLTQTLTSSEEPLKVRGPDAQNLGAAAVLLPRSVQLFLAPCAEFMQTNHVKQACPCTQSIERVVVETGVVGGTCCAAATQSATASRS